MSSSNSISNTNSNKQQKERITKINTKNRDFREHSTNFWKVLLFFFIEGIIPLLVLWLLTYPRFKFAYRIEIGLAIGLALATWILIIIFTIVGFFLECYNNDQFIFNSAFFGAIIAFYISDFWVIRNNFLYMFLFCLGCAVVFLMIGGVFAVLMKNLKLKFQK